MAKHPYHLKYYLKTECGVFTKEQLDAENNEDLGGTDALMLVSVIDHEGLSVQVFTFDGRTKLSMPDADAFKAWILMANRFIDSEDIPEAYRTIAVEAFLKMRCLIAEGK